MAPTTTAANVRARVAAALLLPLALISCSLPTDERVTPYNPADLPDDLTNTTTTSTTTTTTTLPGPISVPDGQSTTTTTTTTLPALLTSPVDIYYTLGFSDEMQKIRRDQIPPVPIDAVITQLETPVGDIAQFGLRSAVRPDLIADVELERATATVTLNPSVLDRLSNDEQRRATAQIVLTLTSFLTADEGAIGFVRFEVDGEGFAVFVPSLGGSSDPGEPMAFIDFASLVVDTSLTSPTTTTTSTTVSPISDG